MFDVLCDEATERAVLSACLIGGPARDYVLLEVEGKHFAFDRHRAIYAAMRALDHDGIEIDLTTLQSRLGREGVEKCGGPAYLATMDVDLPDLERIESYVEELKRWTTRRELNSYAEKLAQMARDMDRAVPDLIDDAEGMLEAAVNGGRPAGDFGAPGELASIIVSAARRQEDEYVGEPTGIVDLDRLTLGMEPGHQWVLAGRPSTGKTLVAGVIGLNVARRKTKPVVWFTLEMMRHEVAERLLTREVGIPHHRIRRGSLSELERVTAEATSETLGKLPLHICEQAGLKASEVVSMCRRQSQRLGGLGLVIVDYLGLMDHGIRKGENEATAIGRTSAALKEMAKNLRVPVLLLAQLNRESEHRTNRRPMLADLRGSGAIEQDADVVVMLYREMPNPGRESSGEHAERVLELHVTKNRHGATGMVETWFMGETMEIQGLERGRSTA